MATSILSVTLAVVEGSTTAKLCIIRWVLYTFVQSLYAVGCECRRDMTQQMLSWSLTTTVCCQHRSAMCRSLVDTFANTVSTWTLIASSVILNHSVSLCIKKKFEQQFDFLLLALFGSSGFSISVLHSLLVYRYYCCLAFAYAKSLSSVYLTALKPPVLEEFFWKVWADIWSKIL